MFTQYIEGALEHAEYEKVTPRGYAGRIPLCPGVVAFGKSLRQCERELQESLEGWVMVKIRHGDILPTIAGINLNRHLPKAA